MDQKPLDGGPAFARPGHYPPTLGREVDADVYRLWAGTLNAPQAGMSYVDWIAGIVMARLVASQPELPTDDDLQILARRALAAGRAILLQRGT